ncbi:uncharacterized protein BYT42DRAFT_610044 [Radiomyces spectabilis]|uniref:uncharacterized protein n=1 Tax=Radiomyces spectabilis TaxID=64574 RepID=UPI002220BE6F|nr:uncharacterized protein BYT42DRAFT_610044 [Radiomyces spectabilis]KAI8394323.1 hypothetical protein BYT42DRAFT_610044 [Radiomyces spectabilis]
MSYFATTTALKKPSIAPMSQTESDQCQQFSVPTPPPSASPVELPPILDICESSPSSTTTDNRPPSPASSEAMATDDLSSSTSTMSGPAPFLEPVPQLYTYVSSIFRPHFTSDLKVQYVWPRSMDRRATIPSAVPLHVPIPRRLSQQPPSSMQNRENGLALIQPKIPVIPSADAEMVEKPRSLRKSSLTITITNKPVAILPHTGNEDRSDSVMNSTVTSTEDDDSDDDHIAAEALASASADAHRSLSGTTFMVHGKSHSSTAGPSMFLTKNAHIKRPRNAWIHFRCHYGQALKAQDPTLRAEEISKRASRRWAKLTEVEKRPWHKLADQEKQAHKEAFPEYRYCPKRASSNSSISSNSTSTSTPEGNYRLSRLDQSRSNKRLKRRAAK